MRPPGRSTPLQAASFPWAASFAVWTAVGLFALSQAYLAGLARGRTVEFGSELLVSMADAYQWALWTPVVFWLAHRFPLVRGRLAASVPMHLLGGSAVAMAVVAGNWLVWNSVSEKYNEFWVFAGLVFMPNVAWYATVVGARYGLDYYRRYRERELRASQLEAMLADARVEALRMQIQPHFLYNTLNTIAEAMHHDVRLADRMMSQLGSLLRLTFERPATDTVPLQVEMQFARAYLELQQARFEDRLRVEVAIEPQAWAAEVPNFILQPLVENAIRHGLAGSRGVGTVEIRAARADGVLRIEVADDGVGLRDGTGLRRTGVGLSNVAARLEHLYGADQRFELRGRPGGGASAVLEVPFRIAAEAAEPAPPAAAPQSLSAPAPSGAPLAPRPA